MIAGFRPQQVPHMSGMDKNDLKRWGSRLLDVLGFCHPDFHGIFTSSNEPLFEGGGRGGKEGGRGDCEINQEYILKQLMTNL